MARKKKETKEPEKVEIRMSKEIKMRLDLDKVIYEMIHGRETQWGNDHVPFYSHDWLHMKHYLLDWLYSMEGKRVIIQTVMTKKDTIVSMEVEDHIEGTSGFTQQVAETFPMALCMAVVELKDVLTR